MILQNLQLFLWWWGTLVLLGIVILPLTVSLFPRFVDKGYIFSKILSIALVSYLSLFFGILHIFRFNQLSLILFLGILTIFSYGFFGQHIKIFFSKKFLLLVLFEEFLFVSTFLFWVTIRGFNPEIHGLEKYMDFGFINSILRSEYFPPLDMWFSPFSINYYYFGHLYSAVLTKLSGIPSNITYNLLLGTVAGLCMTASFSLALNLLHGQLYNVKRVFVKIGLGALLAAALVTFGGNLHTIYTLYPAYENEKPVPFWTLGGPLLSTIGQNSDNATPTVTNKYLNIVPSLSTFPNEYWYPNATRYIFNTIHEFPIYSWVVADLHGHVLDIPFVLLTIAMLYSLFTLTSIKDFSAIHE